MQRTLFLILTLLMSHPSLGQTGLGTLTGRVTNTQDIPIPGLHVEIKSLHQGTVTDAQGSFRLDRLPAGTYTVRFSHIAYQWVEKTGIQIPSGNALDLGTVVMHEGVLHGQGIVVTATRTPSPIVETPAALNLVPQSMIRDRNGKTLAEALREESGVAVQKTGHGGGSAIIRGLSSNQILLLVDGIRLNNSTYRLGNHPYLTTVDDQMVRQMEVVRGPMSVLYGSDALGGTINAVTDMGTAGNGSPGLHYRLFSRLATADQEKTARAELGWQGNTLALEGGFSVKDFGDLRRGTTGGTAALEQSTDGHVQKPTAFQSLSANAKAVWRPDDRRTLIAAWQMTRRPEVPRYDKYESGTDKWLYKNQNRDLFYLKVQDKPAWSWLNSVEATLSYQRQGEGRDTQKRPDSDLSRERDETGTWGATLQAQTRQGRHALTTGFEAYFDQVDSQAETVSGDVVTRLVRGRYPDGATYHSYGAFMQDAVHLSEGFRMVGGLRYSRFAADFRLPLDGAGTAWDDIRQTFDALCGSLGLVAHVAPGLSVNANLGQAFRAPNLSDIGKLGESKGNVWEVPNTDLKPERLVSVDLGLRVDRPGFYASASVYYAKISDLVASADDTYMGSPEYLFGGNAYKVKSKQNIGEATLKGLEAEIDWTLGRSWAVRANVTMPYGQNTTLDEPVGGVPPAFGLAGLRWFSGPVTVEAYARLAAKQDRLSADDLDDSRIPPGGTPGWQTLNLRTAWQATENLRVQAALENILDQNYREHGSGVNAPGRNAILSLEWAH